MEYVKLLFPEEIKEETLLEYLAEWGNETIVPHATNLKGVTFEKWLERNINLRDSNICPPNHVPAVTLFMVDEEEKILGAVDIRIRLNNQLLLSAGHIGYGIRPSERGKGYGKTLLNLGLHLCTSFGINRVLLVCKKDNVASRSVIIFNGGILENEVEVNGVMMQRYWIDL